MQELRFQISHNKKKYNKRQETRWRYIKLEFLMFLLLKVIQSLIDLSPQHLYSENINLYLKLLVCK